ncbi:hypothetical protein EJF18_60107 [Clavispora lusitaniae]|uniref:Uncharacterized protein n=1 Tax=Clavispora lusitaniae TaxID=36911 RepID=A0ACD0WPX5_CLALS|nr:hypothetical protein EJF14_60107 [Clavispora lusitaniae]QFZ35247.1 hypothetical protein EJF16_60107 [Clavispora lusitaniae]QFZ40941.1 hypothetical protein EJF15_60107 [Clavispora lusitaniae]QFZ46622.1 hypothetical protein EJF18_60107 [Clavispora lusitaniae]QFZ52287.1 hypothetical protein EJF17_60107 [Clavispora lusitaniae]
MCVTFSRDYDAPLIFIFFTMSHRESQEGLLELEDFQNGPKCPPYSEEEPMMPIEVKFRICDEEKFSSAPTSARFAFNENSTVEEAAERAFQKAFGCVPAEIHSSIEKREANLLNETSIVDKEVKIKHLFKEDDILVLSDNCEGYRKKQNRKACIFFSVVFAIIFGFFGLIAIIATVTD